MSQENLDLVRRGVSAFKAQDLEGLLACFDPALTWTTAEDEPDHQTYHGFEGVLALIADWRSMWTDDFFDVLEPLEFIAAGEFVVMPARILATGRSSGVEVEILETYVFRIHDGRGIEVREFRTPELALAALDGWRAELAT